MVNALVASLVVLAAPAPPGAPAHDPYREGDPFAGPPSLSLWVQPLGTAFILATGSGLYLPLGANVRSSENFDVQLELTLLSARRDEGIDAGTIRSTGFTFTCGPLFRKRIFFLAPKLVFAVQRDRVDATTLAGEATTREGTAVIGHLGADVGMEMRAGGLMLGFSAGASAGVCRGCRSTVFSPFGALDGGAIAQGKAFLPSVGVNVNLLRVGAAF